MAEPVGFLVQLCFCDELPCIGSFVSLSWKFQAVSNFTSSSVLMWVNQTDQLCLLFTCLGVGTYACVCVHVCMRACTGGRWERAKWERQKLLCARELPLGSGLCWPPLLVLHPDSGNNGTQFFQHLCDKGRGRIWNLYYLTVGALSTLMPGILVSRVYVWAFFLKGNCQQTAEKKLNIVCPLYIKKNNKKTGQLVV